MISNSTITPADAVRHLRTAARKSQSATAAIAGITQETVSRIERGYGSSLFALAAAVRALDGALAVRMADGRYLDLVLEVPRR